jgi:lactate dehydrogenase-like 2-hydroxyacid dehydrogenase
LTPPDAGSFHQRAKTGSAEVRVLRDGACIAGTRPVASRDQHEADAYFPETTAILDVDTFTHTSLGASPRSFDSLRANGVAVGLVGRTFGIIGLGNIGREILRLAVPFSMRHLAYDP